jgi:tetratricopeptide (TPR) repeat protein
MPSRRLFALLLEMDEACDTMSGLTDDQLGSIVRRSLAGCFGGLAGDNGLSVLQRALDECVLSGPPDRLPDKPALCRMLYDRLCVGVQVPDVSFDMFEAAFGRFIIGLRAALAQATEPQLIDPPCREFGSLNLDELSRMQAPEELSGYMAGQVTYFQERQAISAADADHVIGLVEKMVSAPGYLRFLGEDKKREEIARLLNLAMVVQTSGVTSVTAGNDLIVTLGLLLYNISPSEKAASCLAAVRPSDACPALQYHYNAIMALNYMLTARLDLAARHAAMASESTVDRGMIAYVSILQGCIAIGQGDYERAIGLLEKAGSCAPGGRIKALAFFFRGLVLSEKGEYVNAIGCFREAGAHVTDPMDQATIHNNIGSCASYLGDLTLAELSFTEMEKLSDRLKGDSALQCRLVASSHFGALWRTKGEYPRAVERFGQALKLALRSGDGKAVANQMGNLGTSYACAGEAGTALQYLNTCMALSERMSYWSGIRFAYWHIGRLLAEKGNRSEARKFLDTYSSRYPELRNLR